MNLLQLHNLHLYTCQISSGLDFFENTLIRIELWAIGFVHEVMLSLINGNIYGV